MSFDRLKPAFDAIPGSAFVLRFDEEGRATPGDAEDVAHIGAPGEGFVWLHVDLGDPDAPALLKRLTVLNDDARKTLSGPIDTQFIEHSGDIVRGAFIDRERGVAGKSPGTDYLRFAFGELFLVSARQRQLHAVESTITALRAGRLASSPLELFETIVGHLCDELGRMISELTFTLDRIEERIVTDGSGLD
ncbi:MAG: CorA family divalent cation transporter, partial [Methylocystis sp.]